MPSPPVLFLHGGPGMTAELERRQFGSTLPVHWWDQPVVGPSTRQPFAMLIDAAAAELARMSTERQERIDLLANSFGAYLARALVDCAPQRIGRIVICGGVFDLASAILRFASRLAERRRDTDLEGACQRTAQTDTPECYVALLARASALPGFLDCYWGPAAGEQRESMKALAAEGRLLDWPTCQSVMTAALAVPQGPLALPHPGAVRILLGRFDPYFDESDITAWTALWPSATVEVFDDVGHFPHLELPPSLWMPGHSLDL